VNPIEPLPASRQALRPTLRQRALLGVMALLLMTTLGCNAVGAAFEQATAPLRDPTPTPLLLPVVTPVAPVASAPIAPATGANPDAPAINALGTPLALEAGVPLISSEPVVAAPVAVDADATALVDAAGLDFAERRIISVYETVSPSVVNINTQVLVQDFFGVVPEEGSGSGFVLDTQGHILTN
jgi:hypothetical protein